MLHPLINEDSPHYENEHGEVAIQEFEHEYTVNEMIAWAKITAAKYRFRRNMKGVKESDDKKYLTYMNYLLILQNLRALGYGDMRVSKALACEGVRYEYRIAEV